MPANPLAALHPNVYVAMFHLAQKRDQGKPIRWAEDQLLGHRETETAIGRALEDNVKMSIQEVWLNKRPPAYYRRLAELARRRDEGQTRFQAHQALTETDLPMRTYQEGRAMIELVWGGSDEPVINLLLDPRKVKP